jgi:membrane protein required for colicin V production
MNVLDILMLFVVAMSASAGLVKGLAREILSLGGALFGVLAALYFAPDLGTRLETWIPYEAAAYGVALVAIFVLVLVLSGLITYFITRAIQFANLGLLNRFLGGVFGVVRGGVIALIIVIGLALFLNAEAPLISESRLAPYLVAAAKKSAPILPDRIGLILHEHLKALPEASLPQGIGDEPPLAGV